MFLLQAYKDVLAGRRHPLVPACPFVTISGTYYLALPHEIARPALLVPSFNRSRDPPGTRLAWQGVAVPNFYCVAQLC